MKFNDLIAGTFEEKIVHSIHLKNKYPPTFIVGVPRSGTTVVYLHMVNTYHFSYFPNAAKYNPRSCILRTFFSKITASYQPTYESSYGILEGGLSPSDGWDIFNRWFPCYDHGMPVKEKKLYELINIIRLMEIIFGAPFLNKNNHNSTRILHLNRLFPDAFFIHVKRDIYETALSLVESREANNIRLNQWWGVSPPLFYDKYFTGEIEQVVYQIKGVEDHIQESLGYIDPDRRRVISYKDFCDSRDDIINWTGERYRDLNVNIRKRKYPGDPGQGIIPGKREIPGDFKDKVDEALSRYDEDVSG